jgi:TPR repeat protein
MSNLGVVHYNRGDLTNAEHWYRRAADAGHPAASHNLRALLEELGAG